MEDHAVIVTISDSRPGGALGLKKKIFNPSYTEKKGLPDINLCIAERIISDHGASFGVSDGKWGGAEFRIEIPVKKRSGQA